MQTLAKLACLAAIFITSITAMAQDAWPSKPLKVVVPFAAGSATDIITRAIADKLADELGKPMIFDYRPGAGGTIGTSVVANGEADGYTLLAHSSALTAAPALFAKLPYDTRRDLAGVTMLGVLPAVIVVNAAKPYTSLRELVAAARARPGQLSYGTGGIGSGMHMNSEKFNTAAAISGIHVPFKGSAEVMNELVAARLDFAVISLVSAKGYMRDGRVRALAVPLAKRTPLAPDLPTAAELGFAGGEYLGWIGMLAPAKTPRPVIEKLYAAIARIVSRADVRERLQLLGAEPDPVAPAEFDRQIASEMRVNMDLAKAVGIQPQ